MDALVLKAPGAPGDAVVLFPDSLVLDNGIENSFVREIACLRNVTGEDEGTLCLIARAIDPARWSSAY
jgi:hypothetical protein